MTLIENESEDVSKNDNKLPAAPLEANLNPI